MRRPLPRESQERNSKPVCACISFRRCITVYDPCSLFGWNRKKVKKAELFYSPARFRFAGIGRRTERNRIQCGPLRELCPLGATIVAGAHNIPFDEEIALEHVDLFEVRVMRIDRTGIHSNGIP